VITGRDHKYGYNGKEENDELGFKMLDFGARNYMADLGRWGNIDPYAHNYMKLSPYNYATNNPVFFIDKAGKFIVPGESVKKDGRLNKLLKSNFKGILGNKRIMRALRKHGQFTDAQIKKHLTFGEGPTLEVKQLNKYEKYGSTVNGHYSFGDDKLGGGIVTVSKSTILDIDVDLIDKLENAKGRDKDYYLFLVASTILHELVHYGEDRGEDKLGEEGDLFESDAYFNGNKKKRLKTKDDAKKLLDAWIKKFDENLIKEKRKVEFKENPKFDKPEDGSQR